VTPIYKVHPSPVRKRVEDFAELLAGVVKAHDLDPAVWGWSPDGDASLADYLARLPVEGPQGGIGQAIQRQAVMINRASSFSGAPGEHHGIGVEPYARFSSPMREMVGIHTHKEALEKLSGRPPPGWVRESEASRADMVEVANESQRRQKRLAKAADKLVLDHLLGADLAAPEADRPVRAGTVLGVSAKKVYMRFDDPPLEVKLYVPDLERAGAKLELSDDRAVLRSSGAELPDIRVGDSLAVKVDGYEADRGRYQLALA
jgi:ribonuclease R